MLKQDRSDLDHVQLTRKARRLPPQQGRGLKLALLGDVSVQHLVPLLRALFASNGVGVEVYEAGFDTVEVEALDPRSSLYGFGPDVVVILQGTEKLKGAFYEHEGDRSTFAREKASQIEETWKAIRKHTGATIVQSTFVLPYERPFGNYGHAVEGLLQGAVEAVNREIALRARNNPGVLVNDVDYTAAWLGRRHFIDEKLWALFRSLCALELLPEVAQNIVDIVLAAQGRAVKCVVVDLDNTIWGGVVGDDGIDGIELGDLDESGTFRSMQLFLRELARRGILLAVCSKNDEAIARRVFREHPGMVLREEHIAVFVANWDDKATNIRRIREQLHIGLDSMVFLDDNPFERNLVRQLLPEVVVPELPEDPGLYVRAISELNLFEAASHSALDGQRVTLHREEEKRHEERSRFTSLEDYLRSLETVARVARFVPRDLPRIAQLLQRSNQFNLTTRRHSDADCATMMRDERNWFPFSISVRDRFGDFGLISVVILRLSGQALEVDTFVMSCRVLQRGVEQLAMNEVFALARQAGCDRVTGEYIPTAKNGMVKDFFEKFGFHQEAAGDAGGSSWTMGVDAYVPRDVQVRRMAEEAGEGYGP
ncbi:MAG: HAD-IIIC family phosphatase [Deltaproteobacteria bacterium]